MGGYPKSSIFVGFSLIKHPFFGVPSFYGNLHIQQFNPFLGTKNSMFFFLGAAELATLSKLSSQGVNLAENSRKGRW